MIQKRVPLGVQTPCSQSYQPMRTLPDFLYDYKKGGLYFNENGADKGFGDGGIIDILKDAPDLTINNLDFT